ncbi:MAG: response regulator [Bryobacteraceae bacterium]
MQALVIDDSRAVRMIIGKILRDAGMDVLEAGDGRQGIDQLEINPDVELILVDWNMPVMNGYEFIQAVRAQQVYDRIRIMMVTTEAESEQVTKALAAGVNEYLMKPFTKEVLIAKLSMMDVLEY